MKINKDRNDYIQFKKEIKGKDFIFKVEQKYEIVEEDVDSYYVLQPNSPKNSNWVCRVSKKDVNIIYKN